MSDEKLSVDLSFSAVSRDDPEDGFSASMDIKYRNVGRLAFASLEKAMMQMFANLADADIQMHKNELDFSE